MTDKQTWKSAQAGTFKRDQEITIPSAGVFFLMCITLQVALVGFRRQTKFKGAVRASRAKITSDNRGNLSQPGVGFWTNAKSLQKVVRSTIMEDVLLNTDKIRLRARSVKIAALS